MHRRVGTRKAALNLRRPWVLVMGYRGRVV